MDTYLHYKMFYEFTLKDYISINPREFSNGLKEAVVNSLKHNFVERTDEDIGIIISVLDVLEIGEGFKLPENEDRHFPVIFKVLTYKPEIHEVVEGEVSSVTNFGAFVNIGVLEGLIHLTQTMSDFVSFSKTGIIQGKETSRTLKAGDAVRCKIIAVSFKDLSNIKVGLTMRQPGLGALEWLKNEAEGTSPEKKKKK